MTLSDPLVPSLGEGAAAGIFDAGAELPNAGLNAARLAPVPVMRDPVGPARPLIRLCRLLDWPYNQQS